MKIRHAVILFVFIFLMVSAPIAVKSADLYEVTRENIRLNRKLDKAAYDTASGMVEYDMTDNVYVNKDEAVDFFFHSLATGLGRTTSVQMEELRFYVPVILITDLDGFYISFLEDVEIGGEVRYVRNWTEKIPYSFTDDDGYVYQYSIGLNKDFVTVYDSYTGQSYSGLYSDVKMHCAACYLDAAVFHEMRQDAVISAIERKMSYFINNHNLVASRFGMSFTFYLPVIDRDSWLRTIDDISFLFLFQGYPLPSADYEYYSRIVVAGSRVAKSAQYYINSVDGQLTYHRHDCTLRNGTESGYRLREQCAGLGAYPCDVCKP